MEKFYRILGISLLLTIVSIVAASYYGGGIASVLLSTDGDHEERIRSLQSFFDQMHWAAPLVYIAMVVVEVVVAPIPGTLLYLPGGMIFGLILTAGPDMLSRQSQRAGQPQRRTRRPGGRHERRTQARLVV